MVSALSCYNYQYHRFFTDSAVGDSTRRCTRCRSRRPTVERLLARRDYRVQTYSTDRLATGPWSMSTTNKAKLTRSRSGFAFGVRRCEVRYSFLIAFLCRRSSLFGIPRCVGDALRCSTSSSATRLTPSTPNSPCGTTGMRRARRRLKCVKRDLSVRGPCVLAVGRVCEFQTPHVLVRRTRALRVSRRLCIRSQAHLVMY